MTPSDLARRAVAAKAFRWMPGMRTLEVLQPPWSLPLWDAAVVINADANETPRVCTVFGNTRHLHDGALPDLTDPCTLGGIEHLAREAWSRAGRTYDVCVDTDGSYFVRIHDAEGMRDDAAWARVKYGAGATRGEVHVAMLEAAP